MEVNIAFLSSGEGNITDNVIQYFNDYVDVNIPCIISEKSDSEVLKRTRRYKTKRFASKLYKEIDFILQENKIDYIILDNWYEILPTNFCKKYKGKIISSYHSKLPKYSNISNENIYNSILKNKDKKIGFSVFFVEENNDYDIILTTEKKLVFDDGYDDIKSKCLELEKVFLPRTIENLIKKIHR